MLQMQRWTGLDGFFVHYFLFQFLILWEWMFWASEIFHLENKPDPKTISLYFEWSPPWHFKTTTIDFMSASSPVRWGLLDNVRHVSYRLKCILSGLFSGISSDNIFWHSFWHIFWHYFWHFFWHSFWHIFWQSCWQISWHSFWHASWHTRVSSDNLSDILSGGYINSHNPHLTGGEKDNQSSLAKVFVPMTPMTLGGYRICMYLLRYCDSDCDWKCLCDDIL